MKGIIMGGESIQAILDGRKTMTRRIVEPQPTEGANGYWYTIRKGHHYAVRAPFYEKQQDGTCVYPWGPDRFIARRAPHKPGDILYVKEAWKPHVDGYTGIDFGGYIHRANSATAALNDEYNPWRSPMFMPRAAARIFLRVTDVLVERLQEITEEDAEAEGVDKYPWIARWAFEELWNFINGNRDGGKYAWSKNPWVWVYTFEPISKQEAEATP